MSQDFSSQELLQRRLLVLPEPDGYSGRAAQAKELFYKGTLFYFSLKFWEDAAMYTR